MEPKASTSIIFRDYAMQETYSGSCLSALMTVPYRDMITGNYFTSPRFTII